VRHALGLHVGLALAIVGYGKRLPRRPAPDDNGSAVVAVVASLPSPQALLAARQRVAHARLVHQDLLPPALLAAEPLVASVMCSRMDPSIIDFLRDERFDPSQRFQCTDHLAASYLYMYTSLLGLSSSLQREQALRKLHDTVAAARGRTIGFNTTFAW
jgi:hypothetical protein